MTDAERIELRRVATVNIGVRALLRIIETWGKAETKAALRDPTMALDAGDRHVLFRLGQAKMSARVTALCDEVKQETPS